MIKVLITGGAGFIGSHLSKLLIAENVPLRIIDSLSPQIHGALPEGLDWLVDGQVEFIRGSITDRQTVETALYGITHIIHLAAETGTGQSMYEMARYNEINSQGTALLLDILANKQNHGVQRLILSSSRSVYGEGAYVCQACGDPNRRIFPGARSAAQLAAHAWEPLCPDCGTPLVAVPTRETDPIRPASVYAATKYAQEDLVRIACDALGIGYAILRLQNVYGEGQSLKNPYTGILSIFSTRIRRGLELPIFEDGLETRDFVHVEDVARVMYACIQSPESANKVVNVGSGTGTSVMDVARLLTKSLQREVPIRVTSQFRLGDIRHNVADVTLLRELGVGGSPVALADGLNRFAAWVLTQPLPEDGLDRANAELQARKLMA